MRRKAAWHGMLNLGRRERGFVVGKGGSVILEVEGRVVTEIRDDMVVNEHEIGEGTTLLPVLWATV